jgi:membrane protein
MTGRSSLWREVLDKAIGDRISLVAAGCAFYAMLAFFPALSLCITVYGFWFDLATVEPQLAVLERLLPEDSYELIAGRVQDLVSTPRDTLGVRLAVASGIALWSASAGIRALLNALNMAQREREQRGAVRFYATALLLTVGAVLAVTTGLALLVALPSFLAWFSPPLRDALLLRAASFGLLLVAVLVAISLLYRFGPARPPRDWRFLSQGALLATLLWVVASAAFSFYVTTFAAYDAAYGPLGAAVALLTWLYVSVYLVLLGAEWNAAIARRRLLPADPPEAAGLQNTPNR